MLSLVGVLVVAVFAAGATAAPAPAAAAASAPKPPDDPVFPLQWNLQAIGAPSAWATATGQGTVIAIVDSGVEVDHEDLASKIVGHVSCLGTNGSPSQCTPNAGVDDDGHGTHVAGIAAAATNNGIGIAGVAPDAGVLDVKALAERCTLSCTASGTADDVAAGIRYAADHGATVINLSLGNTTQSVFGPAFSAAIRYAWSKGVISVVAAGNDALLPSGFSDEPAIVVGALARDGTKASYANTIGNAKWALMAPGGEADTAQSCQSHPEGIISTYLGNRYVCLAGTSMAAPHVAGAAALLRSIGLGPQETVDRLLATARPLGDHAVYGAGALDVAAAVGAPPPPSTAEAAAVITTATPTASAPVDATGATTPAGDSPGPATAPAEPVPVRVPPRATPGGVTMQLPADQGSSPPVAPVAVAVALATMVATASAWQLVRGTARSGGRSLRHR